MVQVASLRLRKLVVRNTKSPAERFNPLDKDIP